MSDKKKKAKKKEYGMGDAIADFPGEMADMVKRVPETASALGRMGKFVGGQIKKKVTTEIFGDPHEEINTETSKKKATESVLKDLKKPEPKKKPGGKKKKKKNDDRAVKPQRIR